MSSKTDTSKETNIGQTNPKSQNTESEPKKQSQSKPLPNGMTPENAKAINISKTKGGEAAVKYMFNPTGKRQLSYDEMRSRFG